MKMKHLLFVHLLLLITFFSYSQKDVNMGYPYTPVNFTSVKVTDTFWGARLDANRNVTIPLAFSKCEETGRYDNFVKAANPSPTYKVGGLSFDDTDVYKTIEGASYSMQTYPDKKLDKYIDSVLTIVAGAQEADGYLFTSRTMNPDNPHEWAGDRRWVKVEDLSHEFYNLGHMIEGAIAHYHATGKRNFLDIAIKYADNVEREIGDAPGKQVFVPGHQIAEMALAKLYLVTGEKKYIDLAKFFLDKRGYTSIKQEYSQSHKPVLEQDEAVGHAVRATYMYSGMADVAAIIGDSSYIKAIDNIWENVVTKKIYLTGGIGATHHGEAFGPNYHLPNKTAYNETCAAIANVYWNHRMFLLHGDAKYYDVLERTLYNGLISGVSMDGGEFFYPNPLESDGKYKFSQGAAHRQPWFGCACCPSNISRFIPSLPGYIYATKDNSVYINLFMSNSASLKVEGRNISLKQTTNYPWDGDITVEVTKASSKPVNMMIRIPGWIRGEVLPSDLYEYVDNVNSNYEVKVNGKAVSGDLVNGYLSVERRWRRGDKIEVNFDLQPRVVKAHEKVEDDRGKIAFERGPIVYCAEWPDNKDIDIPSLLIPKNPKMEVIKEQELLNGVTTLKTDAQSLYINEKGMLETKEVSIKLIPYYSWAHRGVGQMSVWLPTDVSAVVPLIKE